MGARQQAGQGIGLDPSCELRLDPGLRGVPLEFWLERPVTGNDEALGTGDRAHRFQKNIDALLPRQPADEQHVDVASPSSPGAAGAPAAKRPSSMGFGTTRTPCGGAPSARAMEAMCSDTHATRSLWCSAWALLAR